MKTQAPFSLLVKPVSADCNLNCEYCFYIEKSRLYPETRRHRMSSEVLEQIIKTYMSTEQPVHSIGWQGGEPTLMGTDFFREVTRLQEKYGRSGATVANGLQTNATLIDDDMAEHLGRYRFLVGCSLDGPEDIHDSYRRSAAGGPSHADVLRGIQTLKRHSVEFNILVLVSQANIGRAAEVYRYLVDQGFLYHQYIPCVEFTQNGDLESFAITGEQWGAFLCEIFDLWCGKDTYRVSIRHFDSILVKLVEKRANVCTMARNCCQYLLVEHNGDIYPCDFFVEPRLLIGNVTDISWESALRSPVYRAFGRNKRQWNAACDACEHVDLCSGDCLKHRTYCGNPPEQLSWLCAGWKRFFAHTRDKFEHLARELRNRQAVEADLLRARTARVMRPDDIVGRNDPCPCGSGLKYKKCCGRP